MAQGMLSKALVDGILYSLSLERYTSSRHTLAA